MNDTIKTLESMTRERDVNKQLTRLYGPEKADAIYNSFFRMYMDKHRHTDNVRNTTEWMTRKADVYERYASIYWKVK